MHCSVRKKVPSSCCCWAREHKHSLQFCLVSLWLVDVDDFLFKAHQNICLECVVCFWWFSIEARNCSSVGNSLPIEFSHAKSADCFSRASAFILNLSAAAGKVCCYLLLCGQEKLLFFSLSLSMSFLLFKRSTFLLNGNPPRLVCDKLYLFFSGTKALFLFVLPLSMWDLFRISESFSSFLFSLLGSTTIAIDPGR